MEELKKWITTIKRNEVQKKSWNGESYRVSYRSDAKPMENPETLGLCHLKHDRHTAGQNN